MSRFMLDLLALAVDGTADPLQSSQRKTIRFATVVETLADSMGADLSYGIQEETQEIDGEG